MYPSILVDEKGNEKIIKAAFTLSSDGFDVKYNPLSTERIAYILYNPSEGITEYVWSSYVLIADKHEELWNKGDQDNRLEDVKIGFDCCIGSDYIINTVKDEIIETSTNSWVSFIKEDEQDDFDEISTLISGNSFIDIQKLQEQDERMFLSLLDEHGNIIPALSIMRLFFDEGLRTCYAGSLENLPQIVIKQRAEELNRFLTTAEVPVLFLGNRNILDPEKENKTEFVIGWARVDDAIDILSQLKQVIEDLFRKGKEELVSSLFSFMLESYSLTTILNETKTKEEMVIEKLDQTIRVYEERLEWPLLSLYSQKDENGDRVINPLTYTHEIEFETEPDFFTNVAVKDWYNAHIIKRKYHNIIGDGFAFLNKSLQLTRGFYRMSGLRVVDRVNLGLMTEKSFWSDLFKEEEFKHLGKGEVFKKEAFYSITTKLLKNMRNLYLLGDNFGSIVEGAIVEHKNEVRKKRKKRESGIHAIDDILNSGSPCRITEARSEIISRFENLIVNNNRLLNLMTKKGMIFINDASKKGMEPHIFISAITFNTINTSQNRFGASIFQIVKRTFRINFLKYDFILKELLEKEIETNLRDKLQDILGKQTMKILCGDNGVLRKTNENIQFGTQTSKQLKILKTSSIHPIKMAIIIELWTLLDVFYLTHRSFGNQFKDARRHVPSALGGGTEILLQGYVITPVDAKDYSETTNVKQRNVSLDGIRKEYDYRTTKAKTLLGCTMFNPLPLIGEKNESVDEREKSWMAILMKEAIEKFLLAEKVEKIPEIKERLKIRKELAKIEGTKTYQIGDIPKIKKIISSLGEKYGVEKE